MSAFYEGIRSLGKRIVGRENPKGLLAALALAVLASLLSAYIYSWFSAEPSQIAKEFRLERDFALSPAGLIDVEAEVRLQGSGPGNWHKVVRADPGEVVQWLLNTRNYNSDGPFTNVVTRAVLPPNVTVVPGSMRFVNARGEIEIDSAVALFIYGINSGRYNPGENSLIIFDTRVVGDFSACSKRVRLVSFVRAQGSESRRGAGSDADLVITRRSC